MIKRQLYKELWLRRIEWASYQQRQERKPSLNKTAVSALVKRMAECLAVYIYTHWRKIAYRESFI